MKNQGKILARALGIFVAVPASGVLALGGAAAANAACVNTVQKVVSVCVSEDVATNRGEAIREAAKSIHEKSAKLPAKAAKVLPVPLPVVAAPEFPRSSPAAPSPQPAPDKAPVAPPVQKAPETVPAEIPKTAVSAPVAAVKTVKVPATTPSRKTVAATKVAPAAPVKTTEKTAARIASPLAHPSAALSVPAPEPSPAPAPAKANKNVAAHASVPVMEKQENWFKIDGTFGLNPSNAATFVFVILGGSAVATAGALYWGRKAHLQSEAASA